MARLARLDASLKLHSFEDSSLEQDDLLSEWLAREPALADVEVSLADRNSPMLASYFQQSLWIADAVSAETDRSFVVQHSWRINGVLELNALRRTLSCLVDRHEVFRIAKSIKTGLLAAYRHIIFISHGLSVFLQCRRKFDRFHMDLSDWGILSNLIDM